MQFFDYYHAGQPEVALDVCKPKPKLCDLIWKKGLTVKPLYSGIWNLVSRKFALAHMEIFRYQVILLSTACVHPNFQP